jgi:hypothetical protein
LLAALMRPFTAVPPAVALAVWDAVSVSVLAALFVLIVRLSAATSLRQLLMVGLLYGFYPLDMSLGTGQIDALIALLALVSFLLYRADRPRWAGIVLACIALIKPTVGALILFYCCRRAWPVVAAFAATVAAGIAASAAVAGSAVLWEYREVAVGWADAFGVLPLNQSIHGLVARLLAPAVDRPPVGVAGDVSLALEALLVVAAGALTVCLLRGGEPAEIRLGALQYYAAFSVLLLGIPFTENTHLTWLLPGVGVLLVLVAQQRSRQVWHALFFAAYGVLALPITEISVWHAGSSILGRLSSGSECYGLAILTACMAYAAFAPTALPLGVGARRLCAVRGRPTNGEQLRKGTSLSRRICSPSSSAVGRGAGTRPVAWPWHG